MPWGRLKVLRGKVLLHAGPRHRSGIITFVHPSLDSAGLVAHLLQRGVQVSLRHGWVRIAPHHYNNESDIDAMVDGVEATLRPAA